MPKRAKMRQCQAQLPSVESVARGLYWAVVMTKACFFELAGGGWRLGLGLLTLEADFFSYATKDTHQADQAWNNCSHTDFKLIPNWPRIRPQLMPNRPKSPPIIPSPSRKPSLQPPNAQSSPQKQPIPNPQQAGPAECAERLNLLSNIQYNITGATD